jgi:hypothetical protein
MNLTRKIPLLSSIFPENPYSATGLSDNSITSPIKPLLSRIKANFGRNCQNKLNFAARVGLDAAQKNQKNQKTTAISISCGFVVPKKGACKNV